MNAKILFFFLLLSSLCVASFTDLNEFVSVKQSYADTTTPVEILNAKRLDFRKIDSATEIQILVGNVRLRQGTAIFTCDSCVINKSQNLFEAFGHVHINDSDTAHVYSNRLRYLTDKKYAYLNGNVKLDDGHVILTSNELEYDMIGGIGTYKTGGKVINKKSVLTSKEGIYYADLKDIYFKKDVVLKDPAYYLKTDSLLYNTELQTARFIAETYIIDSTKRVIRTSEGVYNLQTGRADFSKRTTIEDGALTVTGDEIANDDQTGIVQIRGRGVLRDTAKGISILANEIFVNKNTEAFLATVKPLMIVKQEADSIYITADTLFSARLSDLKKTPDTSSQKTDTAFQKNTAQKTSPNKNITGKKNASPAKSDSTNRYFEAFRHVRVFSDSVQSISDSLFYSFKDSTFRLFQKPVVWSNGSQITGDTIHLYTKNKKAERIKVFENSFLVNALDSGIYNQIKSSRMDGFFKEGVIDSVRARGYAECIYFLQDEDSAYSGINETKSDIMDVYFRNNELSKVVFRSSVKGTLWPIRQKNPSEMRLKNFQWLEERRPKTKYELFE
jgi:lipopolysaccharide export system protein LptA